MQPRLVCSWDKVPERVSGQLTFEASVRGHSVHI
jgi:hypothetical protein